MSSMADLTRNFGWIPWCITVIGWFLQPIINKLVDKVFAYLVFDAPKELDELDEIIRKLKKTLSEVEKQTVLRAAEDKGSQISDDLKTLDSMKMALKSALYEAEDIRDLVDYRRKEKEVHLGDDDSVWVEKQLDAASAWIARCKGSCFGRWIHVTVAAVMMRAQSMIQKGQLVIQGLWHSRHNFHLFCTRRAINTAGAAVLQCAQSCYHQLWQLFRRVIQRLRSGSLLPVSNLTRQPPCREPIGPESVPADPALMRAVEMLDGQGTEVKEGEGDEIKDGQEGAMLEDETEAESSEGGEVGEEGEPSSLSILRYCARSMLTWFAKAYFIRDRSYEFFRIKTDKKDASAVESLVGITKRISLKNRMKRIEDTLHTCNKSDLLNDNNSSSGPTKDTNKESSREQKEIDDMHSRMIVQEVFGRDKDRDHISWLLRDGSDADEASSSTSKPYSVIGIYGITGSGKTTLAKYVCDYEKGAGHFNPIMFIHVGKTFKFSDIFRNMLGQIIQSEQSEDRPSKSKKELAEELRGKDLESLKTELWDNLKGKRFLLVLDDLWFNDDNQNGWDILLGTLSAARSGSMVLVTAQKADAAGALGAHLQPFSIPDLEEEAYLSLFMHHAQPFSIPDDDYGKYERIGRKIANRLRRSPIAAVTVAKQLQKNKSISFWDTTANLDMLDKTMGALWWSYEQLGVDIRRCFAYCSIFPKGYELERDELVHIWMAQGFVETRSNATEDLEDVGHRYFDELLTFSFLQEERKYPSFIERETFTIHDLLHEFAERVCGNEFFRIGLNTGAPIDIPRGVRHLFVETNNGAEIIKNIVDMENLRTLIIKEPLAWHWKTMKRNLDIEKVLDRLFMRLTKLRVLIIKLNYGIEGLSVPASIDHMVHLRYLGFHGVSFKLILPRTFSKLYHIQIIDIPCFEASCPEDMANLICLRHISCPLSFPNIGRLTSLQTIGGFTVKEAQGYELKQLKHLNKLRGTLCIKNIGDASGKEDALEAHLTHKERLKKLELHFDFGWYWNNGNVEAETLEGLCPPKGLEELKICNYKGSAYPTWMLTGRHPDTPTQLRKLTLFDCSQLASIPEDSELFSGLGELRISDWDRLPQDMECLVALQSLEISLCRKMEHLPRLPQALKNIEILMCTMLTSIGFMECPRLEFVCEQEKRPEACTSPEYCQDSAPTGTPEQSPYPMIHCPCLVTLTIMGCNSLVTLLNLPPSLKKLRIQFCGELCTVSGQLGGLEELHISSCDKLRSVHSLGDASSLETLSLYRCQCLTSLGSGTGPRSCSALRRLVIKYCPVMDMKQFNKNVLDGLLWKVI